MRFSQTVVGGGDQELEVGKKPVLLELVAKHLAGKRRVADNAHSHTGVAHRREHLRNARLGHELESGIPIQTLELGLRAIE